MNDGAFTMGIVFGIIVSSAVLFGLRTCNVEIMSGKQFILKNQTYKCQLTNELKADE